MTQAHNDFTKAAKRKQYLSKKQGRIYLLLAV